jgi:hypothetical protein
MIPPTWQRTAAALARVRAKVLFLALAAAPAVAQAPLEMRVALVIGNASYANAPPLINPVRDATAIGAILKSQGFTVLELRNAGKTQMEAAIAQAREALKDRNGVGLLFYAGHGLQVDWRNYMVPIDANLQSGAEVPKQAVDVQKVIAAFKAARTRMNIIVLDACRDNPFGAAADGKGLAQIDAPPGTFLAYATAPGNLAEDGDPEAGHSLYTQHLLQELKRSDVRIEDVFKRVRFQVRKKTMGRQVPWESTSLEEDFTFERGIGKPIRQSDRALDEQFETELAEWNRIKESKNVDDFYAFINRFPSGLVSELAQARLERLQRDQLEPAQTAAGVALGRRYARYELGDIYEWEFENHLDQTKGRYAQRVTAIDGERVEFNNGAFVLTQDHARVKDASGQKDPPIIEIAADMALGKRWRTAFTNT